MSQFADLVDLLNSLEPPNAESEPLAHSDWVTLRELLAAHEAGEGDFSWEIGQMAAVLGLTYE